MKTRLTWCLCATLFPFGLGCSEQTRTETREAAKAVGEAAESAAADAKVNAEKAGEVVKEKTGEVVEAGKEAIEAGKERLHEATAPDAPADKPATNP